MTFKLQDDYNLLLTKSEIIRQGDVGGEIIFLIPTDKADVIIKYINGGNVLYKATPKLVDTDTPYKENLYRYSLAIDEQFTGIAGEIRLVMVISEDEVTITTNEVYINIEPVDVAYTNE